MEGIQTLKSLIKKGDFMVKLDLSDAYFGVPIEAAHHKFIRFSWRGKIYEFQALPFGLGVRPHYYTKLLKPVIAFLRRIGVRLVVYLDDMILLNQCRHMLIRDLSSLKWLLENLGFLINWKKSVCVPTQVIQFLGFLVDSVEMVIRLPQKKIQKIIQKCQCLVSSKVTRVRKISEVLGLMTSSLQAIAPAPLHYPSFANDPGSSLAGQQVVPGKSDLDSRLLTGTQMVDFADAELEWEVHNLCRARLDDNQRCIQKGVGCDTWCQAGSGPLDLRGGRTTYQCTGIERGSVCFENICSEYAESSCPLENGQQNSSCLHPEDGRDLVCAHVAGDTGNLEVCARQGNNAVCEIITGLPEHRGGLAVQELSGQRLAVEEKRISATEQSLGTFPSGSVCEPPQYTAEKLCQLALRPICADSGRFSETLEGQGPLFISTFCHDCTVFDEGPTGEGISGAGSTTMADPTMVPVSLVNVVRQSDPPPSLQGPFIISHTGNASTCTAKPVSPSGVENLRRRDLDQGISEQAAELLTKHSWRRGTTTAYNSSWRQWCGWCDARQIDPFCAPVVDIVN